MNKHILLHNLMHKSSISKAHIGSQSAKHTSAVALRTSIFLQTNAQAPSEDTISASCQTWYNFDSTKPASGTTPAPATHQRRHPSKITTARQSKSNQQTKQSLNNLRSLKSNLNLAENLQARTACNQKNNLKSCDSLQPKEQTTAKPHSQEDKSKNQEGTE
jgi:hypothetical protein